MISTLLLTFLLALTDTSAVSEKIRFQSEFYGKQLEQRNEEVLSIWALNQLILLNCDANLGIVKNVTQPLSEYAKLYETLSCKGDLTESLDSVVQKVWTEEHKKKYEDIVRDSLSLTEDVLGFSDTPLLHLKLLMSGEYQTYYNEPYLSQALDSWVEQIENYEDQKDLRYSIVLSNMIWAAYRLKDYKVIQKYHKPFLESKYLPLSFHKLRIDNAVDYVFYVLGHYDKSLEIQRQYSIPLAKYSSKESELTQILLRQGVYLYSLGKYEASKKIYENLYRKTDGDNFYIFTNLGINYYRLGYSNKYISFQLKALEHTADKYEDLLNVYRNLFLYYSEAKDVNSALSYIDKAKEVAIQNSNTTELALIDLYLGSFYWNTYRDHQQAINYLNSAEEILSAKNNYVKYSQLLIEKGAIYITIDSLKKAELIFQKVKELSLSKSDTPKYIRALIYLTDINLRNNNLDEASKNLSEIKLYSLDQIDFQLLTKYYTVKTKFLVSTENMRKAKKELEPVIAQIIDLTKSNTDSQEGYWTVDDSYLEAFELMVDLYIESGNKQQALITLDRLKTINDASLYNSPLVKAAKLSEQQLAEEKRLNEQLQRLRKNYLNADEDERFSIKTEIERISAEREEILANINVSAEESLPPLWRIQRTIAEDEMALHFTELGEYFYVSKITSNDIQINKYDFPFDLQQQFSIIGDELASGETNLNHLYTLYRQLGLNEIPENINRLTIIPDEFVYRIPLEILPTKKPATNYSYGSTTYLIEDYRINYFNSLGEIEANRRSFNTKTNQDFTAFAISDFSDFQNVDLPSLPYATEETQQIYASLNTFDEKQIHTGDYATKEAFKNEISSSRMVHVATHSEISEQDPLFSTIYLKGDESADSLESEQALYAYELFDTPLQSEFIMLNSCSSGSGNYMQGTGILGISRALRYAGVKGMALNLWSVNDKVASEISTDFYEYLNEGVSKDEAMRKAKLNQLKSANANPHFWGAYMMIGNPAPVTSKTDAPYILYALLGATILLSGYVSYQKEKKAA